MVTHPVISVIIAMYNAESYLRRCLDSLLSQTLNEFDVIVVDDGSTDGSLAIALEYASSDNRFRVFHKENGGVSSARQYGVDQLAEGGEYSIHLDPDDWIEATMLEHLYKKAKDTNADMVICDFFVNTENGQYLRKQNPGSTDPRQVLGALFEGLHGSLWNKLIRSSCYKTYNIHFPPNLNYCEDYLVNVSLLLQIDEVAYLPEAFYHYDQYSNCHPATRNEGFGRINQTRIELVTRCREIVPDSLKNWQYNFFEVQNAFSIIKDGSMPDKELKEFFKGIPASLLLRRCRPYFVALISILTIHAWLSQHQAVDIYKKYMTFKHRFRKTKWWLR